MYKVVIFTFSNSIFKVSVPYFLFIFVFIINYYKQKNKNNNVMFIILFFLVLCFSAQNLGTFEQKSNSPYMKIP